MQQLFAKKEDARLLGRRGKRAQAVRNKRVRRHSCCSCHAPPAKLDRHTRSTHPSSISTGRAAIALFMGCLVRVDATYTCFPQREGRRGRIPVAGDIGWDVQLSLRAPSVPSFSLFFWGAGEANAPPSQGLIGRKETRKQARRRGRPVQFLPQKTRPQSPESKGLPHCHARFLSQLRGSQLCSGSRREQLRRGDGATRLIWR